MTHRKEHKDRQAHTRLTNKICKTPQLRCFLELVEGLYMYTRQIPLTLLSSLSTISAERARQQGAVSFVYNLKDFTSNSIHMTKKDFSLLFFSVEILLSELKRVNGIWLV